MISNPDHRRHRDTEKAGERIEGRSPDAVPLSAVFSGFLCVSVSPVIFFFSLNLS
jgi:hypothetical protein